jgi:hypothetical protein
MRKVTSLSILESRNQRIGVLRFIAESLHLKHLRFTFHASRFTYHDDQE